MAACASLACHSQAKTAAAAAEPVAPARPIEAAPPAWSAATPQAGPLEPLGTTANAPADSPLRKVPRLDQQELRARFAVYPKALTDIVPMGEQTVAHGVPMAIAYFETQSGVEDILTFYAQHFASRHWSRFGTKDTHNWIEHPAIVATDPDDLTQMSVMVLPGGKGASNTVILAIANARTEAMVPEESELPSYPGSQPIRVRTTEVGVNSFAVGFTTPDPEAAVGAFYRSRMRELGWDEKANEGESQGPRTELVFVKGGRSWRIGFSRQKEVTLVNAMSTTQEADEQ